MKRILLLAAVAVTVAGCAAFDKRNGNEYDNPFYAKYLNTGSALDANINRALENVRANPRSPEAHNVLGALLVDKGFPKDAEREFERALNADDDFYPAWYNLGLVRAARGDESGARRAFYRAIDRKPGHAAALFQLGLIEENLDHKDRAVALYAKAFAINPALLDVRVNPRILDTELIHLALLKAYPNEHTRRSMQFQGTAVSAGRDTQPLPAPSPQQAPQTIITPAPPTTDPSMQPAPSAAPAAPAPTLPRSRRPRRPTTPPADAPPADPAAPPADPAAPPSTYT